MERNDSGDQRLEAQMCVRVTRSSGRTSRQHSCGRQHPCSCSKQHRYLWQTDRQGFWKTPTQFLVSDANSSSAAVSAAASASAPVSNSDVNAMNDGNGKKVSGLWVRSAGTFLDMSVFPNQISNLMSELRKATDEITRLREEVSLMTKENIQLKVRAIEDSLMSTCVILMWNW